jgi:hypothetical protein
VGLSAVLIYTAVVRAEVWIYTAVGLAEVWIYTAVDRAEVWIYTAVGRMGSLFRRARLEDNAVGVAVEQWSTNWSLVSLHGPAALNVIFWYFSLPFRNIAGICVRLK